LGQHFQQNGYLTRAILLPGHGTVPGALLNVQYEQWLQACRYGIATLKKEVDRVFLVGFSTGGSLALYHTLTEQDSRIAGLILICPAIKIRNPFAFVTNWHRFLFPQAKRLAWFKIASDEMSDYAKYSSVPYNGIYQVYRLSLAIRAYQDKPHCPLFFCVSDNDDTVDTESGIDYFKRQKSPKNRILIYTTEPTRDEGHFFYRNAVYPDQHIVSASHISLPISPNNPHYGKNGDFPLASHVDEIKNTIFGEFDTLSMQFNRVLYQCHLTQMLKNRLTFNPDFNNLANMALQFVKENE
jgi:esterase/lipase